jgi:hypothetical protein
MKAAKKEKYGNRIGQIQRKEQYNPEIIESYQKISHHIKKKLVKPSRGLLKTPERVAKANAISHPWLRS